MMNRSASTVKPGNLTKKRIYNRPVLTKYGDIGKLTAGGAPSLRSDHGNNSMWP